MKRIVIKKDEFVDVLHGTSIALGFVAGLGAVLRWVPSPYVGVAAIATSAAGCGQALCGFHPEEPGGAQK
jgi:hypothetical protein